MDPSSKFLEWKLGVAIGYQKKNSNRVKRMEELLMNMNLKESGEDSWSWKMDSQGVFTVNKLSKLLQKRMPPRDLRFFILLELSCPPKG